MFAIFFLSSKFIYYENSSVSTKNYEKRMICSRMIRLTESKYGGSAVVIDVRSADFEWSENKIKISL